MYVGKIDWYFRNRFYKGIIMNWYKDISKKYTELGLKRNPTTSFLVPFAIAIGIYFVLSAIIFCMLMN